MVDQSKKARQFEGFDINDYVYIDSSANPYGANAIGLYIAGTQANALAIPPNIATMMINTLVPAQGLPFTSIGPQYPWSYEGSGPGQRHVNPANTPINPASVQRTLTRVITNDMNVYFINDRMLAYLAAFLMANPALGALGPTAGLWPLPVPVTLQVVVGLYAFERKWKWLLYQRAVAQNDGDLIVYMEG